MKTNQKYVYTVPEVAKDLEINENHLRGMVALLGWHLKLGQQYMIRPQDLLKIKSLLNGKK